MMKGAKGRPAIQMIAVLVLAAALRGSGPPAPADNVRTVGVEGLVKTPVLAARGEFVALVWSAGSAGSAASDIHVAVSRDAGALFGTPVSATDGRRGARVGGEQPPVVGLVPRRGADPDIVVLWRARLGETTSLRLARSSDGGRSFTAPVEVSSEGAAGDRGWAALVVDDRGGLHVTWLDHRDLERKGGPHAHHGVSAEDGVAMAQRSRLMYWSDADRTERTLATGVCYCCKTAIATRPGGGVFLAWRHVYPGNIRDIAFMASGDGGKTFEPQARVSEDRWVLNGCPDDGPAMAVDETGTIHLAWPTVIGGERPRKVLRYTASSDGRTFRAPLELPGLGSSNPAHVQLAVTKDLITFGWDEPQQGRRQVATVTASRGADRVVFGAPHAVATDPTGGVYPVFAKTRRGTLMAWTSGPRDQSRIALNRLY